MNETIEHIKMLQEVMKGKRPKGWLYNNHCDFLLRHGNEFECQPLPEGIKKGTIKECYSNAFDLVLSEPDLIYVEGYANSIIPTNHAWCATPEGLVVDPTWSDLGDHPGREYFGVPFQTDFVRQTILRNGFHGVIWCGAFINASLMRGSTPEEKWKKPLNINKDKPE
ncbi:hypothetical protein LCGC14_0232750 [marine sediment metagenome]|uniref:Uncharacterized protein n=1 Tax=marine sediment metagenome TaxID=412755 RepID=A0A0F9UER0_9ZZZZ